MSEIRKIYVMKTVVESWWNLAWQLIGAQTKKGWTTQFNTDFYLICLALDTVVFDSMSLYLTPSLSFCVFQHFITHVMPVRIWLPWLSTQHLCIASSCLLLRWAVSLLLKHHHQLPYQLRYKVLVQARAWGQIFWIFGHLKGLNLRGPAGSASVSKAVVRPQRKEPDVNSIVVPEGPWIGVCE